MENGLQKAIEQMNNKEESGLNYIYSKTYNFVYLRAKSILRTEEDIKQLMQSVYLHAYESAAELKKENLYEWLGKCVYEYGCQTYKKKKEREVSYLEMEKDELNPKRIENSSESIRIICGVLDELPDLYQATLFAFYYDYLKINEIAQVMGCSPKTIKNRLNYVRKYIQKAMELYVEEHEGAKAVFSVEAVCTALRKWSVDHCLGMTTAQSVYSAICREAGLKPEAIYLEGKEFAGVNNTVVYHKQDDLNMLQQEIIFHSRGYGMDKKKLAYFAGGGILVIVLVIAAVLMLNKPDSKKPKKNHTTVTKEKDDKKKDDKKKDEQAEESQKEPENAPVPEPQPEPQDEPASEPEPQNVAEPVAEEYIFANSQNEALDEDELWTKTKEELRLARNEIYARHGVIFGVEDLDSYFRSKSWYRPLMTLSDFMDSMELSMVEEGNISLISEVESEME